MPPKLSPLKPKLKKKQLLKEKQQRWVLDCINCQKSKLKAYSSIKDKYLKYFVVRVPKRGRNVYTSAGGSKVEEQSNKNGEGSNGEIVSGVDFRGFLESQKKKIMEDRAYLCRTVTIEKENQEEKQAEKQKQKNTEEQKQNNKENKVKNAEEKPKIKQNSKRNTGQLKIIYDNDSNHLFKERQLQPQLQSQTRTQTKKKPTLKIPKQDPKQEPQRESTQKPIIDSHESTKICLKQNKPPTSRSQNKEKDRKHSECIKQEVRYQIQEIQHSDQPQNQELQEQQQQQQKYKEQQREQYQQLLEI